MAMLDEHIMAKLRVCEAAYLAGLSSGFLEPVVDECQSLFRQAEAALDANCLGSSTKAELVSFAHRVRIVSYGLADLEATTDDLGRRVLQESQRILPLPIQAYGCDDTPVAIDDQAHCAPYRKWFLDHFANPYPSSADKDALLALVPRHTKTQLDTWFVNNRRRSGWAAVRRAHTNGSTEAMRRLLEDVDAGTADPKIAAKVVEVRAFFDEATRDRVSDEIQAIVRNGPVADSTALRSSSSSSPSPPPPPSSSRTRLERRATRGIRRWSGTSSGAGVRSSDLGELSVPRSRRSVTPPHPYARGSPCTTSAISPSTMSPPNLDIDVQVPRYPSTFSSPASFRTASDSSSASLDSLVSYASVDSTPLSYHERELGASSPPATSSLLSFAGPSSATLPLSSHFAISGDSSAGRIAHPYFCTVDELPTSSSLIAFAAR